MKLNDLIDPSNTKQRIARYKEKMNDEIYSFLDSFKCNGEELVVNQLYDGGSGNGKINLLFILLFDIFSPILFW